MRIDEFGLNGLQERFVYEYLKDFNAARAYKVAYGTSSEDTGKNGHRLLKHPGVEAAIREAREDFFKTAELEVHQIINELKAIGFADFPSILKKIDDGRKLTDEESRALAGCEENRRGSQITRKYRMHDKIKALELLGRYKSMFKDNVNQNISGDAEKPVEINLDREARLKRIEELKKVIEDGMD